MGRRNRSDDWRAGQGNIVEAGLGPVEHAVRGEGMAAHSVGKRLCPGCLFRTQSLERPFTDLLRYGNLDGETCQLRSDRTGVQSVRNSSEGTGVPRRFAEPPISPAGRSHAYTLLPAATY